MLKFKVNGQTLSRVDGFRVVGDSRNYLKAEFLFSADWNDAEPKLASFLRSDGKSEPIQQVIVNGVCLVPWEVLVGSGTFEVSVVGGDLITTDSVTVTVYKAGNPGILKPTEATPGFFFDLCERIEALEEFVGELPEGVEAETVIGYIDKVSAANCADIKTLLELYSVMKNEFLAKVSENEADIKNCETNISNNISAIKECKVSISDIELSVRMLIMFIRNLEDRIAVLEGVGE